MHASHGPEAPGNEGRHSFPVAAAIFGSVGISATLCYFLFANVLTLLPGITPPTASVAAYLVSAIVSYFGHKHLSFGSIRANAIAAPRFASVTVAGIGIAYLLPKIAESLELPSLAAYAALCVVIPVVNFIVLSMWVFCNDACGTAPPNCLRLRSFWTFLTLAVAIIAAAAYVFNAWRWGTIADTSWLITVIERIGAGDRLYRDVIELNPPFSIWLYVLPVHLASLIRVAPEIIVRLYTILICLAGASMAGCMLASAGMLGRRSAAMAAVALFAVAVLISGNGFSERDQIGAVVALPLFILAAWRARPQPKPLPAVLHWFLAGIGGGIFAMVKPYYAVVVIASACFIAYRRRDIRALLLPEFVLSGVITAGYLAFIYALYPVFFETWIPLLRDTYMASRLPMRVLALTALPWLALPLVYLLCRNRMAIAEPSDSLIVASLAAWIPCFLQGKGWPYHAYPAIFLGSAALVVCVASFDGKRHFRARAGDLAVIVVAILVAHLRFATTEKPPASLVAAALGQGRRPTVAMLGGAIETGHPLARMIGGRWIEPYCSDWIAVYAIRRERAATRAGNTREAERYMTLVAQYLYRKKAHLMQRPPQILIVDDNGSLVREMLAQFGFDSLLARYVPIGRADGVELYRLRKNQHS